ncbi:MAG TPA: preprotein translocase subunit SecG [Gammaproteobacteria bacterium]
MIVHLLASVALIALVLLQQGKGADMGAAFGSGASSTVFGARGSASFLTRSTAILAAIFFVTSISLAYFSTQSAVRKSVTEVAVPVEAAQPQAPADVPNIPPAKQ